VQVLVRFRWFDTLLLTAAAFFSSGTLAAMSLAPKADSSGLAVIFAPWTSAQETMTRATEAGGRFVRFGAFNFIAIVEPRSSDYTDRLREAWLLADPAALAACFNPVKADVGK